MEPAAMRDALAACGGLDTLVTVVDASVFAKGLWATGARVLERRDLGLDGLTSVYDVLSSAGLWKVSATSWKGPVSRRMHLHQLR